jgi:transcriptional regulator with XRE-family HTH domain
MNIPTTDEYTIETLKGHTSLGMFLKKYRTDKGLLKKDMAKLLGITNAYYSYIERGIQTPVIPRTLKNIAKLTRTPILDIQRLAVLSHTHVKLNRDIKQTS